jgi:lysophospholipase L1-like esterase
MKASAAEAQAAGVRFAILMIPTKELAFYEAYSGQGDAVIEQLSDLARRETEFREKFKRDVCGGDVVCIDPLPVLRDALKAGNCPYPMDSDGHPNPMGHAILAREVWKGLRARF